MINPLIRDRFIPFKKRAEVSDETQKALQERAVAKRKRRALKASLNEFRSLQYQYESHWLPRREEERAALSTGET